MRAIGPLSLFVLLAAACGSTESVFDVKNHDGDLDDAGEVGPEVDGAASDAPSLFVEDSGPASCGSAILCGATGACCAAGQECVEGACGAACASGVRCGAGCCTTGQVCLSGACTDPGAACADSFDCAEDEFCEPTLGKCLPQPQGASLCEYRPPALPLDPIVEWSWTDSTIFPQYEQVINMPVVIDITGDTIPEVIIVTSRTGSGSDADFSENDPAFLRVLDGKTGIEKWAATVDAYKDGSSGADYRVNPRGTPAAGDLDGDGTIEIVAPRKGGGLLAFNADGSLRWRSTKADGVTAYNGSFNSVAVALADLDGDGKSEVVVGGVVLGYDGKLVTDASIGREHWGANDESYGPVSIVADVDGNDATFTQYVVTGNRAIRRDGTLLWDQSANIADGYPAITDFEHDGTPELVAVHAGTVRVQNALTGALLASVAMPGTGRGGPPTVADFDNDGVMEIAAANGTQYAVFEYTSTPSPALSVKWSKTTQDGSSNVTGSSVFDFEGDGAAEVIYNDECYARVYKGTDGTELFKVPNSSATIHEYPVLVDVDGDNNTEFVVAANDRNHLFGGLACGYPSGVVPRHGVFVYGDKNDRWVRTRRVWNEHAYHITNVNSDGSIPAQEPRSWAAGANDNSRGSSLGTGAYNAPDLRVDLEISTAPCPGGLELRARVKNVGSLGVPAGVKVTFYEGTSATGTPIGEAATTKSLLPGESEVVSMQRAITGGAPASFFVTVDGAVSGAAVNECLEDNNSANAAGLVCPGIR
jgi:hypothetical protein